MDGADVMEIGTILSLVEADGTIVIQGAPGKPPLNEGSVLSAVAGGPEVRPSVRSVPFDRGKNASELVDLFGAGCFLYKLNNT